MSHPATFTAYGFTEKGGELQKLSLPWTEPTDGHVVLKVKACGVCAGDDVPRLQLIPTPFPRVPGHEFVGEIVAVPESEKDYKLGQIVGGGWHGGQCNSCANCKVGKFIGCSAHYIHGVRSDGAYAEYVTVRKEALVPVPEGMAPEHAGPLLCAGITVFNSLRNVDIRAGDLVAVNGIGGLGHLAIQFASKMGYRVVALSSGSSKREDCLKLGAFAYLDGSQVDQAAELQKLGGAKVIMLCAPTSNVAPLLKGLAYDGTLLVLAAGHEPTPIPLFMLVPNRTTIRGWPSGSAQDSADCLNFAHHFGIKPLVQLFPLDKAADAFKARSTARYRAVIVPN
ncbi:GroES-like protein [Cristinia sonorae]|uniref:GroES-like protein n=1 Tax=Cristinia sonorae TaxID=1940300 RepID=A0A8K0UHL6_9AGAR|nr:GroES-like protein [Cristinia sonorae]